MSALLLAVLLLLPGWASAARVEISAVETAGETAPVALPASVAAPLSLSAPAVAAAPSLSASPLSAAPVAAAPAPVLAPALAAPAALPLAAASKPIFGNGRPARPSFGRRAAVPGEAPAAAPAPAETPSDDARGRLEALALGLNEAARNGDDAAAQSGLFSRMWDAVRDRRAENEERRLQAKLGAAKTFLRESLADPVVAKRVGAALRAQRVHTPAMDRTDAQLLGTLRRALDGGRPIRLSAPSERKGLGDNTLAAAITYANGDVEIVFHPDSEILRDAPPALLAATLLHELVHSEFKLGEHAAYLTEIAYYARLRSLFPVLAASPHAEQLELLRDCLRTGSLSDHIYTAYGAKKLNGPDDAHYLDKTVRRRTARVVKALNELSAMARDGRWDAIDEKHVWLAQKLPQDGDRAWYFQYVEAASGSLPAGTPLADVFARAARLAQQAH